VGLIQRVVEAAGIATISVTLSIEITRRVRPPRAVYTGFPLGHPLGFPGRSSDQLKVVRFLLACLEKIESPGTLVNLTGSEKGAG